MSLHFVTSKSLAADSGKETKIKADGEGHMKLLFTCSSETKELGQKSLADLFYLVQNDFFYLFNNVKEQLVDSKE